MSSSVNAVWYAESYHPVQAGSIDGTDVLPHDNAVYRAQLCSSLRLYDPFGDPKVIGDLYCTVFVGRLSRQTDEETLKEVMSKYGSVKNMRLVRDIVTGASRGYAFVEYENEREMRRAYEDAHHTIIDGSEVIVDYYRQQLMPGWIPRRLGGGLGGKKESGQLRFGGRERPFRAPLRPIPYDELKKLGIPPPPEGHYMSRFKVPSPPRRRRDDRDREESPPRFKAQDREDFNSMHKSQDKEDSNSRLKSQDREDYLRDKSHDRGDYTSRHRSHDREDYTSKHRSHDREDSRSRHRSKDGDESRSRRKSHDRDYLDSNERYKDRKDRSYKRRESSKYSEENADEYHRYKKEKSTHRYEDKHGYDYHDLDARYKSNYEHDLGSRERTKDRDRGDSSYRSS
ncbi:hypothetical protein LUZ60_015626 [Juncus effusus]|nr:hypothetical protein LUZ60_015626 [Juncus effusus]